MAASEHRIRKAEDISDATGRSVGIGLLDWHLEDQGTTDCTERFDPEVGDHVDPGFWRASTRIF